MDAVSIADIVSLAGVLVLLYKAFTMTPREARTADVGALKTMEDVVTSAMERSLRLNERVEALEIDKEDLTLQLRQRDHTIQNLQGQISDLEKVVDRLVHQVQSLGAEPVIKHKKESKNGTTNNI